MYLLESAVMSGIDPLNGRAPKEINCLSIFNQMFTTSGKILPGSKLRENHMQDRVICFSMAIASRKLDNNGRKEGMKEGRREEGGNEGRQTQRNKETNKQMNE